MIRRYTPSLWMQVWIWFFAAFFAVTAQASQVTPAPNPDFFYAHIVPPQMQAGTSIGEFQLPITIQKEVKGVKTQGSIRFEKTNFDGNYGLTVPQIAPVSFTLDRDTVIYVKPTFVDDGMFHLFGIVSINGVDKYRMDVSILKMGATIYYGNSFDAILGSMANYNLRDNQEYNQLRQKAQEQQRLKLQRLKNEALAQKAPREYCGDILCEPNVSLFDGDPEGKQRYNQMRSDEMDKIVKKINIVRPPKPKSEGARISTNEEVVVTVRWPTDATENTFLPLHGARIEIYDKSTTPFAKIVNGTLDSLGKFTFRSPKNNLQYEVKLIGAHSRFTIEVMNNDDQGKKDLVLFFDNTNTIDIKTQLDHPVEKYRVPVPFARSWSAFQALYELSENAVAYTGVAAAPTLSTVTTNVHMLPSPALDNKCSSVDCAYYMGNTNTNINTIVLGQGNFFDWDVIAHEYGHAIAHQNNSITSQGGAHNGSNQYDYPSAKNSATHHNKQASNRLAMNEAYGTWFAIAFWQKSSYNGKLPNIGDHFYDDGLSAGGAMRVDFETNNASANNSNFIYGEDSEYGVGRFLWDLVDSANEGNQRAVCSTYCKDGITVDLSAIMRGAINGKNVDGISAFYQNFFSFYVENSSANMDALGNKNVAAVTKAINLGALAAEFGLAAHLDETKNPDLFKNMATRNLDTQPVKIKWTQHKTGTMPGLDQFEILVFNEELTKLMDKIEVGTLAPTTTSPNNAYEYTLPKARTLELLSKLKQATGLRNGQKVVLVVKGIASGAGATNGAIASGPYYGNAALFEINNIKLAVIAVDSSGSNDWTDPQNLRIGAANKMVVNMATQNSQILAGTATGFPVKTAAVDFDSGVKLLANFSDPANITGIFNAIDSYGGTDIASAMYYGVALINVQRPAPPEPLVVDVNTPRLYVLTDMDNGAGIGPVVTAIHNATANNVVIHLGHLVPTPIARAMPQKADLRGEVRRIAAKVAEPMDPLTEALLAGGGSYALIQDASAQQGWVDLMTELNNTPPASRTSVNLPLDVKLYGYAQPGGLAEPTYVIRAPQSGTITVLVDGKGNFVPNVQRNGSGVQTATGQDQYELSFTAAAGVNYQITLNEPAAASGLYAIVARQTAVFALPDASARAIPANNKLALLMCMALILVGLRYQRVFSRR